MKGLDKMRNEELLKEIREKSRQAASGFLQPHIEAIEAEILRRMEKPQKEECKYCCTSSIFDDAGFCNICGSFND